MIWNLRPEAIPLDVDGGPAKSFMVEHKNEYPLLHQLSFGKRPEFELYHVKDDPFQMKNLANDKKYAEVHESLKSDLFSYLKKRKDPRMSGDPDVFRYNPYFGYVFTKGFIKWSNDQQGQNLSFEERRAILEKTFSAIGEEAYFNEVLKRQKGKL
ncbi:MAG: hypothetical protein ACI8P3_001522 [Saprospiraceae bacterium]|jgi:hypothetical protein